MLSLPAKQRNFIRDRSDLVATIGRSYPEFLRSYLPCESRIVFFKPCQLATVFGVAHDEDQPAWYRHIADAVRSILRPDSWCRADLEGLCFPRMESGEMIFQLEGVESIEDVLAIRGAGAALPAGHNSVENFRKKLDSGEFRVAGEIQLRAGQPHATVVRTQGLWKPCFFAEELEPHVGPVTVWRHEETMRHLESAGSVICFDIDHTDPSGTVGNSHVFCQTRDRFPVDGPEKLCAPMRRAIHQVFGRDAV